MSGTLSVPTWGSPYGSQGLNFYPSAVGLPPHVTQLLQVVPQQLQQIQQLLQIVPHQLQQLQQIVQFLPQQIQQLQQQLAQQTPFSGQIGVPGSHLPAGFPIQVIPPIAPSIFPLQTNQLM